MIEIEYTKLENNIPAKTFRETINRNFDESKRLFKEINKNLVRHEEKEKILEDDLKKLEINCHKLEVEVDKLLERMEETDTKIRELEHSISELLEKLSDKIDVMNDVKSLLENIYESESNKLTNKVIGFVKSVFGKAGEEK